MELTVLVNKCTTNTLNNFSLHIIYYLPIPFTWSAASFFFNLTIVFTLSPAVHTDSTYLKVLLVGLFKSDAASVPDCITFGGSNVIFEEFELHSPKDIEDMDSE